MLCGKKVDRLCGLVVRIPGYTTEMYCASCEVRIIYICYVEESRPPLWSSGQSSWLQNGDVLCFLWGTNLIYLCYVEESIPPLWSSAQSSRGPGFDSRRYQIFWEVVGLYRAALSFESTTEELLERNSSGSGLENEMKAVGIRHAHHVAPYSQTLALISPTSSSDSIGIVGSRTLQRSSYC
jgi:hypothetical protein